MTWLFVERLSPESIWALVPIVNVSVVETGAEVVGAADAASITNSNDSNSNSKNKTRAAVSH
jgi:hypothetical protein